MTDPTGVVLAVLVPIFWIGLYPNPFLRRLDASVSDLLHQMEKKKVAALHYVAPEPPASIAEVSR